MIWRRLGWWARGRAQEAAPSVVCPHRCCKVDDAPCRHLGAGPADCEWCRSLPTEAEAQQLQ